MKNNQGLPWVKTYWSIKSRVIAQKKYQKKMAKSRNMVEVRK